MPRQSKGARLWLEPERKENGKLRKRATWLIRDGARKISTGCTRGERADAERALAKYIAAKYQPSRQRDRDPAETLVLDVLNLYLSEVALKHARPEETKQRILTLADFWQRYMLTDISGELCRDYVKWRVGKQRGDRASRKKLIARRGPSPRQPLAASWKICARPSIITSAKTAARRLSRGAATEIRPEG